MPPFKHYRDDKQRREVNQNRDNGGYPVPLYTGYRDGGQCENFDNRLNRGHDCSVIQCTALILRIHNAQEGHSDCSNTCGISVYVDSPLKPLLLQQTGTNHRKVEYNPEDSKKHLEAERYRILDNNRNFNRSHSEKYQKVCRTAAHTGNDTVVNVFIRFNSF